MFGPHHRSISSFAMVFETAMKSVLLLLLVKLYGKKFSPNECLGFEFWRWESAKWKYPMIFGEFEKNQDNHWLN
jgi:hypothetical protein